MHIGLAISSLGGGGAERVMSTLANAWTSRGQRVTLMTVLPPEHDAYPLLPGIERVSIMSRRMPANKLAAALHILRCLRRLRRVIQTERPDAIISFIDQMNILTVVAAWGTGVPVIVSERTHPEHYRLRRFWRLLRPWTYRRAAACVVQTEDVRRWACRFLPAAMVHVIPNPVLRPKPDGDGDALPIALPTGRRLLSMGRLIPSKGFDRLLRAFASLAARRPGWSLVILGEGPERPRLETLAEQLGIAQRTFLVGQIREPSRVLCGGDLFVLNSDYEGFPNALCEAMACGLPAVSTDCPSGPGDIVRDGVDGLLVPVGDADALAGALDRLMGDDAERGRLAARTAEVTERFSLERVMGLWEDLIAQIMHRRDGTEWPTG